MFLMSEVPLYGEEKTEWTHSAGDAYLGQVFLMSEVTLYRGVFLMSKVTLYRGVFLMSKVTLYRGMFLMCEVHPTTRVDQLRRQCLLRPGHTPYREPCP